jgi:dihydroorotate dehydrogenase
MIRLPFDIYPLFRPFLFSIDPETAHRFAIACLKNGLFPASKEKSDPVLLTEMCGIQFSHPLGLAAGFDKHAEVIAETLDLGFSFTEIGGVTPLPQPGNPKPRLFRVASAKAIINRFGFNSVGTEKFLRHLVAYRDTQTRSRAKVVGVNLAKNKETVDAADDYVHGIKTFAPYADFLTLNISSPNTPGLRDIQERGALTELLQRTMQARSETRYKPQIFLKIAPDITKAQARDIAEVALSSGVDALIIGNTTTSRPASIPPHLAKEAGGLSGKPLFSMSTELLGDMYQLTEGKIPLIGCGGVFSGADAYAKIRAGATLIQLYTALIYEGPFIIPRILKELSDLLNRDGFATAKDAIGADFRNTKHARNAGPPLVS